MIFTDFRKKRMKIFVMIERQGVKRKIKNISLIVTTWFHRVERRERMRDREVR